MASEPIFESSIVNPTATTAAGLVAVMDESPTAKLSVRSNVGQLGVAFGTSQVIDGALVVGVRPGEWIVLGSAAGVASVTDGVSAGFTNTIDITHSRAQLRVTGAKAPSVLETLCSLDWSDAFTPDGAATSASVAKVGCDIVRNDVGGTRSYILLCDRSFGQYLYDAIVEVLKHHQT